MPPCGDEEIGALEQLAVEPDGPLQTGAGASADQQRRAVEPPPEQVRATFPGDLEAVGPQAVGEPFGEIVGVLRAAQREVPEQAVLHLDKALPVDIGTKPSRVDGSVEPWEPKLDVVRIKPGE